MPALRSLPNHGRTIATWRRFGQSICSSSIAIVQSLRPRLALRDVERWSPDGVLDFGKGATGGRSASTHETSGSVETCGLRPSSGYAYDCADHPCGYRRSGFSRSCSTSHRFAELSDRPDRRWSGNPVVEREEGEGNRVGIKGLHGATAKGLTPPAWLPISHGRLFECL